MSFIGWLIVGIPLVLVVGMAVYVRRYIRGVSDFLVAGRVAGRYVISVAGLEEGLGVLSLVALVEVKYLTGFALEFWTSLLLPLSMFLSLAGFCAYRFRETKAMSIGQFLELRYSRSFRIFATALRTFSELLCNCIGPAVAARFFIYLLGFPHRISVGPYSVSVFMLLMIVLLCIALIIILSGGQISLIVTDCIQALISYPIFVIVTIFVLTEFSWFNEITPIMSDRVPGESFLNPYDISQLRDFNLFALVYSLVCIPLNRAVWYGNGTSGAGRTPHEQKMAGLLGTWRAGLSAIMCMLIAITIITVMGHEHFADKARKIRVQLSSAVADEVVPEEAKHVASAVQAIPVSPHRIGTDAPPSRRCNADTSYLTTTLQVMNSEMKDSGLANQRFQQFRSLYHQNMLPVALRNLLPPVLLAIFALLMVMLMISTDDSRIFNSAATIVQDLIVPLRGKPFTPEQQLRCLRWMSVGVAFLFFFGSMFLAQMDYIQLFCRITTGFWVCGAGAVMTFGLYSRFGTTAGAYAALFTGALFSGGGFLVQRCWAGNIYPLLDALDWVSPAAKLLTAISAPLNPYVIWEMNPIKFPINSTEIATITMIFSILMYTLVSLLTCREKFNLERMLHRGIYNFDGENKTLRMDWNFRNVFSKIIGITPAYSAGDRVIAWSMFIYTFVYKFLLAFVLVVVLNWLWPWNAKWWGDYFFVTHILVPTPIGVITTIWFVWGGIIDLRRMFRDLAVRKSDALDNGIVEGNISLSDRKAVQKAEMTLESGSVEPTVEIINGNEKKQGGLS